MQTNSENIRDLAERGLRESNPVPFMENLVEQNDPALRQAALDELSHTHDELQKMREQITGVSRSEHLKENLRLQYLSLHPPGGENVARIAAETNCDALALLQHLRDKEYDPAHSTLQNTGLDRLEGDDIVEAAQGLPIEEISEDAEL